MADKEKGSLCSDADPKDWEYDFGPPTFTGEIASPYINEVLDDIFDEAFPDGVEAFQKQRAAEDAKKATP